jgi:hypothetical protein
MKCKTTHYKGCECRETRIKQQIEQALQELGAPIMSYEPIIAVKELEKIRTDVAILLYELRKEF